MRWFWIDTFVAFESGKRASAVKNVTLAEEYLHDHFPGFPVLPPPLMIEGMAQTAGILVGEARGFRDNVILAKVKSAQFDDYAGPGDQVRYDAVLETLDERAAVTRGTVYKNGQPIGRVELIFSNLPPADNALGLPAKNFVFTEPLMTLFRGVGSVAATGGIPGDEC
ncbi:MAG TPA: 3-hydroxyacyl-ACP dehydratase FabZ family protein [Phycisphaerae bacterium]|nr:3-hydroxyacyl-ACP dehydratase FabZ family protein [Phycisphaerae bacterium]HNU44364.1 3-hydroxyacyl-ACP dehydratase FabZ family protein [Phycisphaerae bacterium]